MGLLRTFQVLAMTLPSVIAGLTSSAEAIPRRGRGLLGFAGNNNGVVMRFIPAGTKSQIPSTKSQTENVGEGLVPSQNSPS